MTPFRALALAGLAGCVLAAPANAQQAAPSANDDIVVTGRTEQPTSREVNRQAREITHGSDLRHSPLPRFEDRLCPGIIGLKPDFAALMIDRIRYNAKALDRWLGDDTACQPNFIVAFVPDGKAELEMLAASHRELFMPMTTADRKELMAEDGPVRVWTTTQMRTRDGMAIGRRESLDNPPVANMWMAHSKIYTAGREDITSVLVLFDMSDVRGKSLVQLADYATMRGLARTRPVEADGAALDTILALFDPDGPGAPEMTDFDRAYLNSLYNGIPNLPGTMRVGGVGRELRRLAQGDGEAEQGQE
jgi:hypothetical protein